MISMLTARSFDDVSTVAETTRSFFVLRKFTLEHRICLRKDCFCDIIYCIWNIMHYFIHDNKMFEKCAFYCIMINSHCAFIPLVEIKSYISTIEVTFINKIF